RARPVSPPVARRRRSPRCCRTPRAKTTPSRISSAELTQEALRVTIYLDEIAHAREVLRNADCRIHETARHQHVYALEPPLVGDEPPGPLLAHRGGHSRRPTPVDEKLERLATAEGVADLVERAAPELPLIVTLDSDEERVGSDPLED